MIRPNTKKRSQAISIDGKVDDRYFAVTSEVPRKIVESRISAIPRNGRSARAGATGALAGADVSGGGSSGEVTGTWSSRAAAAGGGVTERTRKAKEIIESGELSEDVKELGSTRTENRQRICAIACGDLPLKQSVRLRVFAEHLSFRDAPLGAGPESITPVVMFSTTRARIEHKRRGYGFRAQPYGLPRNDDYSIGKPRGF